MQSPADLCITPPRTEWSGDWIWLPAETEHRNVYGFFRQTVETDTALRVELAVTADSFYRLSLDGCFVGRGPARAALDHYSFDAYTLDLAPGRHALGLLVHHIGEENAAVMTGRPGLLVDVLSPAVPAVAALPTSTAWRCLPGAAWRRDLPEKMSHFGFWEECDLGLLPDGWDRVDFDDGAWCAPAVVGTPPCAPWTRLCPRDIPLPLYRPLAPAALVQAGTWEAGEAHAIPAATVRDRKRARTPGDAALPFGMEDGTPETGRRLVVDFGRTVSGDVVLEFGATTAGQTVEIAYDDLLDEAGWGNPARSYAHLADRYRLPGGACTVRTVAARGFRYLLLDLGGAGALRLDAVTAVEETAPFVLATTFESDDEALESYRVRAAETVRICTTDAFTDCATRERVQWVEDLTMHGRVAAYAFGDTAFLRRALFQGAQTALPDGRINGFLPSERTNCAFAASSIMWLHQLVDYHLFAGDPKVEHLLPAAARVLDVFENQRNDRGLVGGWPSGQFWDWAPIRSSGCLLLTNAFFALALRRLAAHAVLARALGRDAAAWADEIATAAHQAYWDEARGLYRDGLPEAEGTPIFSQHANLAAVLAGIAPTDERAALLRRITDPAALGPVPLGEDSLKENNRPSPDAIVPVGTLWFGQFLCQALFETGLDADAIGMMHTLWGAWDGPTFPETRRQHGNTFLCHGWAGGPACLLPAYVLGLQPAGPGWSAVRVRPHPGPLAHAAGTVETPHGRIAVAWRRDGEALVGTVRAPAGVTLDLEGTGLERAGPHADPA
ncbi:MAG: alpha-L-rhamnosidase C-terminal domain-containing protein [Planctomycetota bacterium]